MNLLNWLLRVGVLQRTEAFCIRCRRLRPEKEVLVVAVEDAPLGQTPADVTQRDVCLRCIGLYHHNAAGERVPSPLARV